MLGSVSLAGFGLVLAVGPFELIPLGLDPVTALLWDAGLCLVFFVQHSWMVRTSFRTGPGRWIAEHYHPAVYSIASGVALLLPVILWQRPEWPILILEGPARWVLRGAFVLAALGFVWGVRSLGSFDSFGLAAIRRHLRGKGPRRPIPLAIRGPYRWVRHPLYSVLLVFLWTSPDLTADRLLLNTLFSAWIVVGSVLEERDLVRQFGTPYREYQERVPMLVPWRGPAVLGSAHGDHPVSRD